MIKNVKVINKRYKKWGGLPIVNNYNGKAVLNYNSMPLFAELVALEEYKVNGFDGVWVDNYKNKFRIGLPEDTESVKLPRKIKLIYDSIVAKNGGRAGCWDLILWKDDIIKFVELKRVSKDKIRESQIKWFQTAIEYGFKTSDFEIIEWDLKNE